MKKFRSIAFWLLGVSLLAPVPACLAGDGGLAMDMPASAPRTQIYPPLSQKWVAVFRFYFQTPFRQEHPALAEVRTLGLDDPAALAALAPIAAVLQDNNIAPETFESIDDARRNKIQTAAMNAQVNIRKKTKYLIQNAADMDALYLEGAASALDEITSYYGPYLMSADLEVAKSVLGKVQALLAKIKEGRNAARRERTSRILVELVRNFTGKSGDEERAIKKAAEDVTRAADNGDEGVRQAILDELARGLAAENGSIGSRVLLASIGYAAHKSKSDYLKREAVYRIMDDAYRFPDTPHSLRAALTARELASRARSRAVKGLTVGLLARQNLRSKDETHRQANHEHIDAIGATVDGIDNLRRHTPKAETLDPLPPPPPASTTVLDWFSQLAKDHPRIALLALCVLTALIEFLVLLLVFRAGNTMDWGSGGK